jgi:hypothetical protein
MNGTSRELRWEVLRLLAAQHPGTLTEKKLHEHLRANDESLTKVELVTALATLTTHKQVQRIPGDLYKDERYRITSDGLATFESSSD